MSADDRSYDTMIEDAARTEAPAAVACSLSDGDLARRSEELARDLFAFAEQVDELDDGYVWRFPGSGDWHASLLDFVAAERRCCSFFQIDLRFAPDLGPVWLTLRGPDGTKGFIHETFGLRQSPRVGGG